METDGGRASHGASKPLGDFERVFETREGPVGLLGTAAATGATYELSDIAVYPLGPSGSLEIGVAAVRACLAELKEEIARIGYDEIGNHCDACQRSQSWETCSDPHTVDGQSEMKGALDIAELTREAEEKTIAGASVDDVLSLLRARGCNVIESIKIVSAAAGVSRYRAKQLVHRSTVWSDLTPANDRLHATAEQVADDSLS